MYQEERIYKILKLLREKKSLSNQEIMEKFNISRDTARRDILKLVDEGVAVRTHGGITIPELFSEIGYYKERINMNSSVKIELAKKASNHSKNKQVCFLDVSTTLNEICDYVKNGIYVVTHSIDNMERLYKKECDVNILGGKLNKNNRFLYGAATILQIENIHFDIAFLGAAAIQKDGIYVEDQEDSYIKKKVSERSDLVCVVADDSKFLKTSKFKGARLSDIDILITNKMPPKEIVESLKEANVEIEILEEDI